MSVKCITKKIYFNNFSFFIHTWDIDQNLILTPLLVIIRFKLFLSHHDAHRFWCQIWGRIAFVFYPIVHLAFVSLSTVKPSGVLLMAANTQLRSLREHSTPGRLQWWLSRGEYQETKVSWRCNFLLPVYKLCFQARVLLS